MQKNPRHVAIILDGNRRFAKSLNLDPWKGHEYGEKKVRKLLDWCKEYGIKELTLYAFSMQNFNRPKIEFDYLMKLFIDAAKRLLEDEDLKKNNLKIRWVGRISLFPQDVQNAIKELEEKTKGNDGYTLNMAMAYGGKEELADAMKKIAEKIKSGSLRPEDITEETIAENLYVQSEPDLIIRTGGEKRTSNFLMWQSAYSEWIFLDKKWPEFEKEDFEECLKEYSQRERRLGK